MKKESDLDWAILKTPVVILSVCTVVASVLIATSYFFKSSLEKEYNRNKSVFQSISQRYLDVDQEEKVLRKNYPKFVSLYDKGVIGQEKRLNWIESLRKAGEAIGLPSQTYLINSQEEHVPEYTINYSGYTMYRSSMDLNLGLLHEGDLFKLIDYIDRHADGIYTITECKFSRAANEVVFENNRANVTASCLLYWITIELAGGQRIEIG